MSLVRGNGGGERGRGSSRRAESVLLDMVPGPLSSSSSYSRGSFSATVEALATRAQRAQAFFNTERPPHPSEADSFYISPVHQRVAQQAQEMDMHDFSSAGKTPSPSPSVLAIAGQRHPTRRRRRGQDGWPSNEEELQVGESMRDGRKGAATLGLGLTSSSSPLPPTLSTRWAAPPTPSLGPAAPLPLGLSLTSGLSGSASRSRRGEASSMTNTQGWDRRSVVVRADTMQRSSNNRSLGAVGQDEEDRQSVISGSGSSRSSGSDGYERRRRRRRRLETQATPILETAPLPSVMPSPLSLPPTGRAISERERQLEQLFNATSMRNGNHTENYIDDDSGW